MESNEKNKPITLFVPNGIGDTIMACVALNQASAHGVTSIVLNSTPHAAIFDVCSKTSLKKLLRFDKKPISQVRLFLKLLLSKERIIVAPLVSRKALNFIFFLGLINKKIVVPRSMLKKRFLNLHPYSTDLTQFEGHQVEFIAQMIGIKNQIDPIATEHKAPKPVINIAIGLSCGAQEIHKIPSPEWFARVINRVNKNLKIELTVLGTTSDMERIQLFIEKLDPTIPFEKLINLKIEDLLTKLRKCHIGVAGTTGQGHIFSVAKLPQAVICGVTNPHESGPFIDTAAIIKHEYLCGPCYQADFNLGCQKINCMESIDPAVAAETILELLFNPKKFKGWLMRSVARTNSLTTIKAQHGKRLTAPSASDLSC